VTGTHDYPERRLGFRRKRDLTAIATLSLATGLRADLRAGWGARVELDTRAFGRFEAGAVGWSVGVARRF
jgi:hypothetical protein